MLLQYYESNINMVRRALQNIDNNRGMAFDKLHPKFTYLNNKLIVQLVPVSGLCNKLNSQSL